MTIFVAHLIIAGLLARYVGIFAFLAYLTTYIIWSAL